MTGPRPPVPVERRITALGTSMVLGLGPGRPGAAGVGPAYPVRLERLLRAQGIEAVCTCRSRSRTFLGDALDRFEEDVIQTTPEVVLLHFGTDESFSGALPLAVRHRLDADLPNQAAPLLALRRRVDGPLRRLAVATRRAHHRVRGGRAGLRSPERVGRELALFLRSARRLAGDPLVVVLGMTPSGDRMERAMPGIGERRRAVDDVLRRVSDEHGATYVDLAAATAGTEAVSHDGIHLNEAGHAAVAELLAGLLVPHLTGS